MTLNSDMKDNDGGFNCGKPAGWIEDFAALPDTMKDLFALSNECVFCLVRRAGQILVDEG